MSGSTTKKIYHLECYPLSLYCVMALGLHPVRDSCFVGRRHDSERPLRKLNARVEICNFERRLRVLGLDHVPVISRWGGRGTCKSGELCSYPSLPELILVSQVSMAIFHITFTVWMYLMWRALPARCDEGVHCITPSFIIYRLSLSFDK